MSAGPGLEFENDIAELENRIAALERQTDRSRRDRKRDSRACGWSWSNNCAKPTARSMPGKRSRLRGIRIDPTHATT